jgi:arsenate reductase
MVCEDIELHTEPIGLLTSYPAMKIYHLANCSTCQRILGLIPNVKKATLQEIKTEPITAAQLDELKELAGSYEALFSKIAMKYRSMGLNEMKLTEKDFRKYILEEYTFLKRPTIVIGNQVFVGSAPKTVKAMLEAAAE